MTGDIHLRLHYRKRYDDRSEAAEEIRLINDILKLDEPLKRADKIILKHLAIDTPEHHDAKKRIRFRKLKLEKYISRKKELHSLSLLSNPLSPFELEDSRLTTENPIEIGRMRLLKYEEFIQTATESYNSYKLFNGKMGCQHKTLLTASQLRLEYLIYFMQQFSCGEN